MKRIFLTMALTVASLVVIPVASSAMQAPAPKTAPAAKAKAAATPAASQGEIDAAKAKGLVWVNTGTGVYHMAGGEFYGTTKAGKFMTEDDAKKGGFRAAKASGGSKKGASKTNPAPAAKK